MISIFVGMCPPLIRPCRPVHKLADSVFPSDLAAVFEERLLPVLALPVPARVDELLELPVRDLELVQPEARVLDCNPGQAPSAGVLVGKPICRRIRPITAA